MLNNKMKSTLIAILLLMLFGINQATPTNRSSKHYSVQFCADTYSGRQLYVGEIFTRPGQCIRVQCLGTLQLWEDSCKTPAGLKGTCVALPASDANLDYPKCCPLYECKTYESNARGEVEQTHTYNHSGKLIQTNVAEVVFINKNRRIGSSADILTAPARKYQV
ncbi:uncharacterized protein LOC117791698 [Drosophila innubila]|uniref:uncharacterized protein LOC117791698 n=1 Tax=Drosophila innubila TaxID=198719 RepID=UPI00148B6CB6|nr:uncharacterized protein LOC117791698 [Drosophila innubila]